MKKIPTWFFPITLLWIYAFSIFGILEAGGGLPTWEKIFHWESLMVIGAPIAAAIIFYFLFNKFKWWLVFILTLVLGALMSIEMVLQYSSGKMDSLFGEIVFTILIWPVLIIIPYFLTKLADRSKWWKIIIIVILLIFLAVQCYRLAVSEKSRDNDLISEIFPDTDGAPVLELAWDGELDPKTATRYTPYGIWEAQIEYEDGIAYEPANEMQFYLITDKENFLAAAPGIVIQNELHGESGLLTVRYGKNYSITYMHIIPDEKIEPGTKIEIGDVLGKMEKRNNPTWGEETWWEIQITKKEGNKYRSVPPYDYFSKESKEILNAIADNSKETNNFWIAAEGSHGWTIIDGCSWIKYTKTPSWWASNRFDSKNQFESQEEFLDSLGLGWRVGDKDGRIIGPTDKCQ